MRSLVVEKRRWSGGTSVFIPVGHLRNDEWGTWVLAPPLTPHLHPDGWIEHLQAIPIVGLIPDDRLFTAWFKPHGGKVDLSASNQVDLARSTIFFVDVDLDVVWSWESPPRVVDQEEFRALALPGGLRQRIEAETSEVCQAIDAESGAFGEPALRAVATAVATYGEATMLRDGFAPVNAALAPLVSAAFGPSFIDAWSREPDTWLMCGRADDRITALVRVAVDETAVVALADEVRGTPDEDLVERAAAFVAKLPPPPRS